MFKEGRATGLIRMLIIALSDRPVSPCITLGLRRSLCSWNGGLGPHLEARLGALSHLFASVAWAAAVLPAQPRNSILARSDLTPLTSEASRCLPVCLSLLASVCLSCCCLHLPLKKKEERGTGTGKQTSKGSPIDSMVEDSRDSSRMETSPFRTALHQNTNPYLREDDASGTSRHVFSRRHSDILQSQRARSVGIHLSSTSVGLEFIDHGMLRPCVFCSTTQDALNPKP